MIFSSSLRVFLIEVIGDIIQSKSVLINYLSMYWLEFYLGISYKGYWLRDVQKHRLLTHFWRELGWRSLPQDSVSKIDFNSRPKLSFSYHRNPDSTASRRTKFSSFLTKQPHARRTWKSRLFPASFLTSSSWSASKQTPSVPSSHTDAAAWIPYRSTTSQPDWESSVVILLVISLEPKSTSFIHVWLLTLVSRLLLMHGEIRRTAEFLVLGHMVGVPISHPAIPSWEWCLGYWCR